MVKRVLIDPAMNPRTSLAPLLLLAGLTLGALGDALLRVGPWGVNALIWMLALLATAGALAWRYPATLPLATAWPAGVAVLAAAGLAWRDSSVLKLVDFGICAAATTWVLWRVRGVSFWKGGVFEQGGRLVLGGLAAGLGYLPLFLAPSPWPAPTSGGWGGRVRAVATGMVLAVPLLVVFSALLASADAVFASGLRRLVHIDFARVMSHVVPATICAWITGGWLVGLFFTERLKAPSLGLPQWLRLGRTEVGIALGLVNLLFLAFVLVQFRFLFGGADLVAVTPGLTYAEYARSGFFELVAVAVLAVPVLLVADWALGDAPRRSYRLQAGAMILFLVVILASAFHRMRLYQAEYGWTEQRFYVVVFMLWLTVVLGWFVATVLTGRRAVFVSGAAAAGLVLVAGLHVLNPDAWIVRQNLAQARTGAGQPFDGRYAASLSADAFPVLLAAWPELTAEGRDLLRGRLRRWVKAVPEDWRLWSVGVSRARRAIRNAGDDIASPLVP